MNYIQSPTNAYIKQLAKLTMKKERDKTGQYLVEGFHLVEEALKAGLAEEVLLSDEAKAPSSFSVDNVKLTMLSKEAAKKLSDTENGQGVFALCGKESRTELPPGNRFLLLDAVQDPGNIGTMIRTADAAGVSGVILGTGCGDVYNPKVLRAAQGSHFHVPVVSMPLETAIGQLKSRGIPVYGTALEGASDYRDTQPGPFALIMGNEGSGVDKTILQLTDQNAFIPIFGQSESLNVAVAAGILLYHFCQNN